MEIKQKWNEYYFFPVSTAFYAHTSRVLRLLLAWVANWKKTRVLYWLLIEIASKPRGDRVHEKSVLD